MVNNTLLQAIQSAMGQGVQDVPAGGYQNQNTDVGSVPPPRVYGPMADEMQVQPDQSQNPNPLASFLSMIAPPPQKNYLEMQKTAREATGYGQAQDAQQKALADYIAGIQQPQQQQAVPTHPGMTLAQALVGGIVAALGGAHANEGVAGFTNGLNAAQQQTYEDKMRQYQADTQQSAQKRQSLLDALKLQFGNASDQAQMARQDATQAVGGQIALENTAEARATRLAEQASRAQMSQERDTVRRIDNINSNITRLQSQLTSRANPLSVEATVKAINDNILKLRALDKDYAGETLGEDAIKNAKKALLDAKFDPAVKMFQDYQLRLLGQSGVVTDEIADNLRTQRDAIAKRFGQDPDMIGLIPVGLETSLNQYRNKRIDEYSKALDIREGFLDAKNKQLANQAAQFDENLKARTAHWNAQDTNGASRLAIAQTYAKNRELASDLKTSIPPQLDKVNKEIMGLQRTLDDPNIPSAKKIATRTALDKAKGARDFFQSHLLAAQDELGASMRNSLAGAAMGLTNQDPNADTAPFNPQFNGSIGGLGTGTAQGSVPPKPSTPPPTPPSGTQKTAKGNSYKILK